MPNSIEAVLLDMDGTQLITEPRNRRVHETTAQKYGGCIDKSDWGFLAGTSDKIIWTHLKKTFNGFAIGEQAYIEEVENGYMTDTLGVIVRPGMAELFEHAARRNLRVATVTNAPHKIAHSALNTFGLNSRMHAVISKDDVLKSGGKPKPSPDPWHLATQRLGVDIKRCVIIEDSKNGACSGVDSGAHAVIQIIDPGEEMQIEPRAHAHVRTQADLVSACYKFIL